MYYDHSFLLLQNEGEPKNHNQHLCHPHPGPSVLSLASVTEYVAEPSGGTSVTRLGARRVQVNPAPKVAGCEIYTIAQ